MSAAFLLTVCLFSTFAQTLHAEPRVIDIFNVGGEQDIMQLRSVPRKLFNAIEPNSTRKWETRDQSGFTVIPYVISADYGAKTSIITAAMQSIAANTCIRFKARGNEPDYVEIKNIKGNGCSAFVGHSPGSNPVMLENNSEATCSAFVGHSPGSNPVMLENNNEATCLRHDLVIHELLHVIGLWHEHQRIDRDKYIQVIYSNIAPDDWSQFAFVGKDFGATTYDLPYDYTSVMHYGKTDVIGTAKEPSANDYRKVCLAYGCQTCMGSKMP
ncbi:unnamed protein product [Heligmosomoides polygyrus]|uniref:Metalloendopeptidase n=1 Tax=Heligmosomoides polygyrus TaxID=6339 RepID=A0A183GV64_HELPZ|nr:unnamed protein product [Heligmosomoides polygyrus]